MKEPASWVGQRLIGGRYLVTSPLGEGGMAIVYRARDCGSGDDVVLKTPRRALLEEPQFAQRFDREIRSLLQLVHPHIVPLLDVGVHEDIPFAVLPYLSGGSLRARQQTDREGNPVPLPAEELRTWLYDVAATLDFIHGQHYVHRDIKAENILFDAENQVYVSDFGVAKVVAASPNTQRQTALTGTGFVLGTPQYMAPELIMGQPFDGRVDQYALAVAVYELLSGHYPIHGPTPAAILAQQMVQTPRPLKSLQPQISGTLSAAVHQALAKNAGERFPSCTAFANAVLEGLGQTVISIGEKVAFRSAAIADSTPLPVQRKVPCPACGQMLRLPDVLHGRPLRCTVCRHVFEVPETLPEPPVERSSSARELRPAREINRAASRPASTPRAQAESSEGRPDHQVFDSSRASESTEPTMSEYPEYLDEEYDDKSRKTAILIISLSVPVVIVCVLFIYYLFIKPSSVDSKRTAVGKPAPQVVPPMPRNPLGGMGQNPAPRPPEPPNPTPPPNPDPPVVPPFPPPDPRAEEAPGQPQPRPPAPPAGPAWPEPRGQPDPFLRTVRSDLQQFFYIADTNNDGYLDEEELAVAFRGNNAKPFGFGETSTKRSLPDANQRRNYPDLEFLSRVDKDADLRISRPEMAAYADEMSPVLREANQKFEREQQIRRQLNSLPLAVRIRRQGELDKLRDQLRSLSSQQAHLQALERIAADRRWSWYTWYKAPR